MKKLFVLFLAALALTACSAGTDRPEGGAQKSQSELWLGEAFYSLEISFAPGDSAESVTGDLTLPGEGLHGCRISWRSDAPGTVTDEGKVTPPDSGGVQVTLTADLTLEDQRAEKRFALYVIPLSEADKTPPTITVPAERTLYVGETLSYRADLVVTDDRDPDPAVAIEAEGVNLSVPGEYTVIYRATDRAGNTAAARMTLQVLALDSGEKIAQRDEAMEKVLREIITDQMTTAQKGEAIYDWVSRNIDWAGNKCERGLVDAGYAAFIRRSGDCYIYYAASKLLLDACGIPNVGVERHTSSSHYWLLVDLGTGWYHFDASPKPTGQPYRSFMKTDAELEEYVAHRIDGRKDFYDFDKSLYEAYPREVTPFTGG